MKFHGKKILFISLISFFLIANGFADDKKEIINQQQELEKIKNEISTSKKKLNDLKEDEIDLQKKLTDTDQKIRSNKTVINRLNRQLRQLKTSIESTESSLRDKELFFDLARRRYLGNIRHFYKHAINPTTLIVQNANDKLMLDRQIKYLTALASFEAGNVEFASDLLEETISKKNKLTGERKEIHRLKGKKETSTVLAESQQKKQKRNLVKIRRKETETVDRIIVLQQAAAEMERIIVRIQQEIEERLLASRKSKDSPSFFITLKGHLSTPYRGKIIETFGDKVNPVTNLKSFSAGIAIKGQPGSKVVSVASGSIAYIGNLRGFGNFIIINHDDRFFTTYTGLDNIMVFIDEYILAGNKLAVSDNKGLVKFELRDGRQALDPIEWIRLDSF